MKMTREKSIGTIGNLSEKIKIRKREFVEMYMKMCLPERANRIPGVYI